MTPQDELREALCELLSAQKRLQQLADTIDINVHDVLARTSAAADEVVVLLQYAPPEEHDRALAPGLGAVPELFSYGAASSTGRGARVHHLLRLESAMSEFQHVVMPEGTRCPARGLPNTIAE